MVTTVWNRFKFPDTGKHSNAWQKKYFLSFLNVVKKNPQISVLKFNNQIVISECCLRIMSIFISSLSRCPCMSTGSFLCDWRQLGQFFACLWNRILLHIGIVSYMYGLHHPYNTLSAVHEINMFCTCWPLYMYCLHHPYNTLFVRH